MARALVVATSLALASGCAPSLSQIERGQTPATKEAAYDDFFKAVIDLRTEVDRAEADRKAARVELAKALGLAEDADAMRALEAAGERAKKLQGAGTALHLELTPEARLLATRKGRPGAEGEAEALVKAVEQSVKSSLDLTRRMRGIEVRARDLEKVRTELASKPPAQKSDIGRELDGAKNVLVDVSEKAASQGGLASSFVVGLALALETGAADSAIAKLVPGKARPAGGGGGRPAAAPAPGNAPPPPSKPSEDFEP
ncbi:hypothetical protein [Polyangium aurulentum]|uniref:hypothetical protein n=1 Tax=Polyangium aurulentum TaxID=2567896 RepID=UPI0010ADB069|nr:hypothetical protein [Polyangium aurulentum]UQA62350.1 hypothetical protein E8A73_018540 [Polyangium aurulentum]